MNAEEIRAKYGKKPSKIPSLIKWLHENVSRARPTSNSHFVMYTMQSGGYIYDEKGQPVKDDRGNYVRGHSYGIRDCLNAACYASMRGSKFYKVRVFFNQHLRDGYQNPASQALFKEWFDYVLNRSPFKNVFKNKKGWEKDGVALNMDLPPSVVFAGAIMLRECSEFHPMVRGWKYFKEHGFTEDEAYICSHYFSADENGVPFWNPQGWGHHNMNGNWITPQDARNFVAHKIVCNEPPMKEGCTSWATARMLSPGNGTTGKELLYVFNAKKILVGKGWDQKETVPLNEETLNVFKGVFNEQ
jgi:hypothetical protein